MLIATGWPAKPVNDLRLEQGVDLVLMIKREYCRLAQPGVISRNYQEALLALATLHVQALHQDLLVREFNTAYLRAYEELFGVRV